MAETDQEGNLTVPITCCYPSSIEVPRGEILGLVENIETWEKRELNPEFISSVNQKDFEARMRQSLSPEKEDLFWKRPN